MRAILVFVFVAGLVGTAFADDKAAAEAAFLRGKELMKAGKIAEACDSFARSQTLDPQIGTQYNLGLCYEKQGRWASAWALFREVAQRDSNAARRKDGGARAKALAPKLTKMLIIFEGRAPGLVVTRDGQDVTVMIGVESPVDPDTYEIVAKAPGFKEFSTRVNARGEGMTVTVTIPTLERLPDTPPVEENPTGPTGPTGPIDEPEEPAGDPGRGRRLLGLGVAGGGVLIAGGGIVFGVLASGKWSDAKALCGDDLMCDSAADLQEGNALVSDARTFGNVSTVMVGVGVAAIAGGVILWLTAPSDAAGDDEHALRIDPVVSRDGAFVSLSGVLP